MSRTASASAAGALLLAREPFLDRRRDDREVALKPRKGAAGIGLLVQIRERHAELQKVVGGLRAFRILLIALREGSGGVAVVLAHIIGFAEPVLGIAGERIFRPA